MFISLMCHALGVNKTALFAVSYCFLTSTFVSSAPLSLSEDCCIIFSFTAVQVLTSPLLSSVCVVLEFNFHSVHMRMSI